ncbi:nicotinamide mononucleotide adenylyltransferase [Acrasis kona]|uniref:Nicotinamide mononucleotide adenylyltransferase n=1 Tax=Acrasis kona TaxID=1008807 RepID=A0AAW2Z3T6_9EUKA
MSEVTPSNIISKEEIKQISIDLDSKVKITKSKTSLNKIKKNLKDFVQQQKKELESIEANVRANPNYLENENIKLPEKKNKVVLLHSGYFSPVHNGDIELLLVAKKFHEDELNAFVAGALLSPVHDQLVRTKLDKDVFIQSKHRIAMIEKVVEDSEWIDIDTWDAAQTRAQPLGTVANHLANTLKEKIPGHKSLKVCLVVSATNLIRSPLVGFDSKLVNLCVVGTADDKTAVAHIKDNYEKNQGVKISFAECESVIPSSEVACEHFKKGTLTSEVVSESVVKHVQFHLLGGYALKDEDL